MHSEQTVNFTCGSWIISLPLTLTIFSANVFTINKLILPFRCHFAQRVAANFSSLERFEIKSAKMITVSVCFFLNTIADGKCGRMVFRPWPVIICRLGGGEGAEEFRADLARDFKSRGGISPNWQALRGDQEKKKGETYLKRWDQLPFWWSCSDTN